MSRQALWNGHSLVKRLGKSLPSEWEGQGAATGSCLLWWLEFLSNWKFVWNLDITKPLTIEEGIGQWRPQTHCLPACAHGYRVSGHAAACREHNTSEGPSCCCYALSSAVALRSSVPWYDCTGFFIDSIVETHQSCLQLPVTMSETALDILWMFLCEICPHFSWRVSFQDQYGDGDLRGKCVWAFLKQPTFPMCCLLQSTRGLVVLCPRGSGSPWVWCF